MPEVSAFLNALFSSTDADIDFDLDGTRRAGDGDFVSEHVGHLRVYPFTAAGGCFVFGVIEDDSQDVYLDCKLRPTAALHREGLTLVIWAFDAPVDDIAISVLTEALGMASPDEPIPLPGTDGWALTHVDAESVHSFEALMNAYAVSVAAPAFYGDAVVHSPYVETNYSQEIIVTLGSRRDSKQWKSMNMPMGMFIARLCRHIEGTKDGPAFVLADMVPGQRFKNSVKSLCGVGLDIDTGTPSAVIDAAIDSLNCMAVRYTTHSHGKTLTEFKKDRVIKFAGGQEIDDELIQRFLLEQEKWDASMVKTASYGGSDHTDRGIMAVVHHAPMPKHRIIVPFAVPFEIANEASTQMEAMRKWAKVPTALAEKLGVPLDTSCTDPSRLFYFPRHDKKRPFEISLWGGQLFDWHVLQLDNPLDALAAEVNKGSSKSITQEGRELGRWSLKRGHGFQIVDVIEDHCSERVRGNATNGLAIECPFDELHANAGDTEDNACFVVNAGTGMSEFFTISCRHESCRDKTMLDMLGKMIKDGWFGRDVIEDERYNAALDEDAPQPKVTAKIVKQDEAKAAYLEAIDALTPQSNDDDLEMVINLVLDADLGSLGEGRAEDRICARLEAKMPRIRTAFKRVRTKRNSEAQKHGKVRDKNGRLIFPYQNEFNFDEAFDICIKGLMEKNNDMQEPHFCCIDNEPVRMMHRNEEGKSAIRFDFISAQTLWSELCTLVTFVRRTEQGDGARAQVPKEVASHAYEQAHHRLPQAPEVIYTPVFLSDGKLVVTPKYHYDAENPDYLNILMVDNGLNLPEVPIDPSADDVAEAVNWLRVELFNEFPFLDFDSEGNERREVSEANAFAMILTPFMRRMISGRTPVFFITKPQPGTGGTLLGQMSMWLFDGHPGTATRYSQNEEEMQKGLIAAVQERQSHLFFDNVRDFNNRELLSAITQANISGRLLGSSKNISVPNKFNWIATGNNAVILDEMRRRTVYIRMNAKMPDVGSRKFRHPDVSGMGFESFLIANRGIAIKHILTMIQYWINIGRPNFTARRRASFEDWSAKVGGVLQACGIEGFLDNFAAITTDLDEAANRQFIKEYFKKFGANEPQKANRLFDWALDNAMDILSGNNEDQKRSRFIKRDLISLDGRTYAIGTDSYMFQQTMDDEQNIGFQLVKIPDSVDPAKAK